MAGLSSSPNARDQRRGSLWQIRNIKLSTAAAVVFPSTNCVNSAMYCNSPSCAQVDFMDYLHSEPHAPTALNVTVAATRRRQVRRSARPREYLTEREIEKLMDAASGNRWGHRDATAILFAYSHGLRASELVALRWDDIDFRTGKLHVRRSKGGTASVHPIGGRELRALRRLQREGQAGALCVHLRAPGAPERGRLPAHGCAGWRGGGLPVPDQQPCAASLVRLQAGQ